MLAFIELLAQEGGGVGGEVKETLEAAGEDVAYLWGLIPKEVWDNHWVKIIVAIVVLILAIGILRRVLWWLRAFMRGGRRGRLNARLAIYSESYQPREEAVAESRRRAARRATMGGEGHDNDDD